MPSSYQYQPLSSPATQIRLLELLPGRGIIQCRLKVTDLGEAKGTYEPISYCWKAYTRKYWWSRYYKDKKKQKTYRVLVDDAGFHITNSLRAALRRMRLKTQVRLLWADAICINQADDNEKSVQVSMMGDIYRSGKQTLVWLGDADCWTGWAFRFLKLVSSQTPEASDSTELCDKPTGEPDYPHEDSGTITRHPSHLRLVCEFCQDFLSIKSFIWILDRPYFDRAWIVQELVLSDNVVVMCGKHEITRDELYDGLYECSEAIPTRASLLDYSIGNLSDNRDLYCLDTIIRKLSHTKTSDPRDKFYSVLGLHQDCIHIDCGSLVVDYSKDVDEVFLDATKLLLSRSPSLDLLSMSYGIGRPDGEHVPTWVWNPEPRSTEFHLSQIDTDATCAFHASQAWHSRPQFRGRMLGLLGYTIDKVGTIGKPFPAYPAHWTYDVLLEALRCYFSWVDISGMLEPGITEDQANRRIVSFYCTLMPFKKIHSSWNDDEDAREILSVHEDIIKRLGRFFFPGANETSIRPNLDLLATIMSWCWRLYKHPALDASWGLSSGIRNAGAIFDRCFVRTENGAYGLCPGGTMQNDRLVLLQGATVPFVLRPSGENWMLVGECYISGVMYGEEWDQDRCEMLWIE